MWRDRVQRIALVAPVILHSSRRSRELLQHNGITHRPESTQTDRLDPSTFPQLIERPLHRPYGIPRLVGKRRARRTCALARVVIREIRETLKDMPHRTRQKRIRMLRDKALKTRAHRSHPD